MNTPLPTGSSHLGSRSDSSVPDDFCLVPGYQSRTTPEYYVDSATRDTGIVWQPDVYPVAAVVARQLGCFHILDIGCGDGAKLTPLHPEFLVTGVDYGQNLDYCRSHYGFGQWLEADFESADFLLIPEAVLARTVVVCSDVIEHLVDPRALLRLIRMLLRHAPYAVLSTPEREVVRGVEHRGPSPNRAHVREWSLVELGRLFALAGLRPDFLGLTRSNSQGPFAGTIFTMIRGRGEGLGLFQGAPQRSVVGIKGDQIEIVTPGGQLIPGLTGRGAVVAVSDSGGDRGPGSSGSEETNDQLGEVREWALREQASRRLAEQRTADIRKQMELSLAQLRGEMHAALKGRVGLLESAQVQAYVRCRSSLEVGRALARLGQRDAAVASLMEGLKVVPALEQPAVVLEVLTECGRALVPLDRGLAGRTLEQADQLARAIGSAKALEDVAASRALLRQGTSEEAPALLVSVVIPCFRQAGLLSEAVLSVVDQTFAGWEIVIVNDGSPDDTSAVARSLAARHPDRRIRLIEKPNGGLSSARNAGVRAAAGKYILPLDADDKIESTMLAELVPLLEARPELGFVYGHIRHFGDRTDEYPLPDFDRDTLVLKDNIVCVCSLFRKPAWEQVGGYNEAMREGYEDWDFWISLVERGWLGFCVHKPLFLYRKHGRSMLSGANEKRQRLIARIMLNHPRMYDSAAAKWAQEVLGDAGSPAAGKVGDGNGVSQPDSVASAGGSVYAGGPDGPGLKAPAEGRRGLVITYLISSVQGVTGGNITLLRQAQEFRNRGHQVTIVSYTPKPGWFGGDVAVVQVPQGTPLASAVPPSDVTIATYFTNAAELLAVSSCARIYYAQGDQFVFGDADVVGNAAHHPLQELSRHSYLLPGVRFVANSNNLANAVEKLTGRWADAVLPVCTDQQIFRPLTRALPGSRCRILVVGPDTRGTPGEPLLFKGIQDIRDAMEILGRRNIPITVVRISSSRPEIFSTYPCEFHVRPTDEMKTVLYGTADILVYASHYDSCPRPPQEGMAAGCAVVCTSTSGALEYCRDGDNSLLVPIKSPEAIAGAVERLVRDRSLRERLVAGGMETARQYPQEREWNEMEALLWRFVEEESGRGHGVNGGDAQGGEKPPAASGSSQGLPACAQLGNLEPACELIRRKDWRGAWETTMAQIHHRPFHPEAYLQLAEIAKAVGDSVSARHCAQRARDFAPDWKPARQFFQRALKGNSRPEWLSLPAELGVAKSERRPTLSVCMIVRNEEKFLAGSLASIRDLASQIIVVDTGSTDRTVEIAKENGGEVHSFTWADDFGAARNRALEFAVCDWVLMLDADEELSHGAVGEIRRMMGLASVAAWRLPIVDASDEAGGASYVPRLFRNAPGLYYLGRIHEQVFSSLEPLRVRWGLDNRLGTAKLLHHGYSSEVTRDRRKIERNLRLLEMDLVERPGDPNLLMSLGLELVRSGRRDQGLDRYRQAFALLGRQAVSDVVPELRETLLSQFATHLMAAKHHAELIRVLRSPMALAQGGLSASLHFILALTQIELGDPAAAIENLRQCLEKKDHPSLAPIHKGILSAAPLHCLAVCLQRQGDSPGAAQAFQRGLEVDGTSRPLRSDYAAFLAATGQIPEALQVHYALAQEHPGDVAAWLKGGELALKSPELLEVAVDWTDAACGHHPADPELAVQRMEALMLSGKHEEALPWVRRCLAVEGSPRAAAARVICELAGGGVESLAPPPDEVLASREFAQWYRRLFEYGARDLVLLLNSRVAELAKVLPTAATALAAALAGEESAG